ncbi:MAG: hypothetical protein HW387_35 [Parachlamydiales bacterium]|nr:hypothetical protein [Parachlamydiales bacterium]
MNKYLILFFLSVGTLSANEDLSVVTLANDPSVIIGGAVNAITGELLAHEEDLTIQGAEPIHFYRTYHNGSWSFGSFVFAYERSKHTWVVQESNGGQIKYEKVDTIKIDGVKYIRCTPKNLKEGFSNTAMGAISSRTNFKNNYILIEEEKFRHLIVHAADGTVREYKKTPSDDNGYRLICENLPNGHQIRYDYHEMQHNRMMLTKIRSMNASMSKVFAWADIVYDDPKLKNKTFTVKGSDGQVVRYGYVIGQKGVTLGEVSAVSSSQAPDTSLNYREFTIDYAPLKIPSSKFTRLFSITDPCHPRLQADYYDKTVHTVANRTVKMNDHYEVVSHLEPVYEAGQMRMVLKYEDKLVWDGNRGKVKTLSAPVCADGALCPIYSLIYSSHRIDPTEEKRKDNQHGFVEVFDADLNRTVYSWGDDLRLQTIDRFSKDGPLLNKERYCWGSGADQANLICKSLIDGDGTVISSVRYMYDVRGNVIEKRLYGNLSGAGPSPVLGANGIPIDNGTEVYCKRFRYSSSEPNLLLEESDDSGRRILIDYLPRTDLPISQATYDGDVLKVRKTFEYDADHVLIREVSDDGDSQTIRRITPVAQAPYIGLPHIIEESFCKNGQEERLKKTVLAYTTGAKIARQDVYDAQNALRYSIEMAYDGKGRLIKRTNPIGQSETFTYDACGCPISAQEFSGRITQTCAYDSVHRPIHIKKQGNDGVLWEKHAVYDKCNSLTVETDLRGHETAFVSDALNRRIETHLPPLATECKEFISPVYRSAYDGAGREIQKTDAHGYVTKTSYNVYGKPTLVVHPDNACDEYIYNLDGTLRSHIDPLGITTSYVYDGLKQIVKKTISSSSILSVEEFEYRGTKLIQHIDAEGNRTRYFFDAGGRKIAEECNGEKTSNAYDSLGRLHQEQTGDLCSITEYDLLDRVIEERKESVSGELLRCIRYEYDAAGNRSAVIQNINGQEARESFQYDSMSRLIQKTDPQGAIETTAYQDHFIDSCGQRVLQTIHTDPMSLQTLSTYDAHNHLAAIEKRKERTLSKEEKFFDLNGQPTLQIDTVFAFDGSMRDIRTRWECDSRGRLAALTEADGTLDAKITRHTYQADGQRSQTLKADGTAILYAYDGLGHLVLLTSSDGTVRHQMAYDRLGRLLQSDGLNRQVDAKGRILQETFPCGYVLQNTFDQQGRRIACLIPAAHCRIEYGYNALDLKSISRSTLDGQSIYTHRFSSYDTSGHVLEETLIDGSIARHSFDLCSHPTRINSSMFKQDVLEQDAVGNILRMQTQGDESAYSYDPLYQLTNETGLFAHVYAFDSLNNRLQKDEERYQVNDLNEIVSHLEYDKRGNPVRQGDTRYTYDALDRLIRIDSPDLREDFIYDSLHRCLSKTTLQNGAQKTQYFLYDGQNEIGSFDEALRLQELRILGSTPHAEINSAVAIELQSNAYALIHDLAGNIAALVPLDRSAPSIYRYSAFGEEKIEGAVLSPWRYSSKRSDAATGLVYYGRRYYMPSLGRWLTPDPAGFTDGMNLYAFVHNDPLTHLDEYGLIMTGFDWKCLQQTISFDSHPALGREISMFGVYTASKLTHEIYDYSGLGFIRANDRSFATWRPDNDVRDHLGIDRFFGTNITRQNAFRNDFLDRCGLQYSEGMLPSPCSLTSAATRVASSTKQAFSDLNPVKINNRFHQAAKGLSETGQNNIRILRGWAKSKGWEKLPNPQGAPERWGVYQDGKFEWRLRMKPEGSFRDGLDSRSNISRFDARLWNNPSGKSYINPFTNEVGDANVGKHMPLEFNN